MSGFVQVPDGDGTLPIMNLLLEEQTVTFDIVFDIQGQQVPAKFNGMLDEDNISGEFATDLGNATVTGMRAVE